MFAERSARSEQSASFSRFHAALGRHSFRLWLAGAVALLGSLTLGGCGKSTGSTRPESALLVAGYDPSRTLVLETNKRVVADELAAGRTLTVRESFGGSGKQARAVVDGLGADVVLLGLADDVNALADAKLVKPDWAKAREGKGAPYTSTIVFVVRAGNPKNVRDWSDLARSPQSEVVECRETLVPRGLGLGTASAKRFRNRCRIPRARDVRQGGRPRRNGSRGEHHLPTKRHR